MKKVIRNNQSGFAAILTAILVLTAMLGIAASIVAITVNESRIIRNAAKALKSYYAAEAGIEDSVYRIVKGKKYEATNNFVVGEGSVTIGITSNADQKIIEATGGVSQAVRKLRTTLSTKTTHVAFHYGAQIGEGGLSMSNNATITGNVYSNGNISGAGASSVIAGDAWVAGAVSATADQQWTNQDADFNFGLRSGGVYYVDTAQSFVPSQSAVLNKVSLYLKKVGSPPDQTVRILTDSSGKPSKTSLGSGNLNAALVTANYSWVDVSFSSPPGLTAGTRYWIMIDVSRDDSNYWVWGKDSSDAYPLETGKYTDSWSAGTPVWTVAGGDLNFKTWMGGGGATFIESVYIGVDAHANTIRTSSITRDAYFQAISGSTVTGTQYPGSSDPATKDMPISYAQIQDWEKAACCDTGSGCSPSCVYTGDYTLAAGESLGPIKIEGNLAFPSNSLANPAIIAGPIWVTGTISASNNTGIKLPAGLSSGYPVIGDNPSDQAAGGKIRFDNNIVTSDSAAGGTLLFISTNTSMDSTDPAIGLSNNVNKDNPQSIIFSLNGLVDISNNTKFKEITGYGIRMENNSAIVYEEGLINANFSSGPGAGWSVIGWNEIE